MKNTIRISKYFLIAATLSFLLLNGLYSAESKLKDAKEQPSAQIDLRLNEKTAIKIAELILVSVYGETVLTQRPWKVTDNGNCFTILGTFHGKGLGGVAEIQINKSDARVIKCTHGK